MKPKEKKVDQMQIGNLLHEVRIEFLGFKVAHLAKLAKEE